MRLPYLLTVVMASALASGSALAVTEKPIPDQPMKIDGVDTVCTGSSANARAENKWRAYPMRLEFAGKGGEYLGDETVSIIGGGKHLSVHCGGPWVLMNLPKGTYKLSSDVAGMGHRNMTIHSPGRVIVRFADEGGKRTS